MKYCKICGKLNGTRIRVGDRFVNVCQNCQELIFEKVRSEKTESLIYRMSKK